MNSDSHTATTKLRRLDPDVFLLAAERIHRASITGTGAVDVNDELDFGSRYGCNALKRAAGSRRVAVPYVNALFATYHETPDLADQVGDPIWDGLGKEREPRILGLLLLREMVLDASTEVSA